MMMMMIGASGRRKSYLAPMVGCYEDIENAWIKFCEPKLAHSFIVYNLINFLYVYSLLQLMKSGTICHMARNPTSTEECYFKLATPSVRINHLQFGRQTLWR